MDEQEIQQPSPNIPSVDNIEDHIEEELERFVEAVLRSSTASSSTASSLLEARRSFISARVAHALNDGCIVLSIVKCLLQGPPRVGKTHIKSLVLEQKLKKQSSPSTGCAERPERAVRTEKYTAGTTSEKKWEVMDDDMLAEMISQAINRLENVDQPSTTTAHIPKPEVHEEHIESAHAVIKVISDKVLSHSGGKKVCPQDLMYLIDSGGQPQFQEVLQAFIPNTTTLLLAFNLTQNLSDLPLMQYETDRASHTLGSYAISNEEIICRFARMIYASNQKVQVALIGTYFDKYLPNIHEKIEEKNARLLEIFSFCKDNLLFMDARSKSLLFPIDGLQAEKGIFDDPVVSKLRSAIGSTNDVEKIKVPLRWYAFELALQKFAIKTGKNVLSFSESMELSKVLQFQEEDVVVALEFLSNYNLITYYPSVLPDVIFTTPQVLLNKVTELTKCVYSLSGDTSIDVAPSSNRGEYLTMRDEGIISSRILQDFPESYCPPLFTNEHLLKVFEHLYIVARLEDGRYFMPSLLPHFSKVELEQLLYDSSKPPLLYHFSDGCAPPGLFCALLVCLTSPKRKWKVHLKSKFLKGIKSNAACLQVPQLGFLCIIVDTFFQFEVHYRCAPGSDKYLPIVSEAITEGLEEVAYNRKYNISFPARVFSCRSTDHIGLVDDPSIPKHHVATPMLRGSKTLQCTVDPLTVYNMNEIESKWLEPVQPPPQTAATGPTISELIIELVVEQANWHAIGIFLCIPPWKLSAIEIDERSSLDRLTSALVYWQKNSKPDVNPFEWKTVVEVLRQIGNNRLADSLTATYHI